MSALHEIKGLPVGPFDQGDAGDPPARSIVLSDVGSHPSGMRYEVRIVHPPFVQPPYGNRSAQLPEVHRYSDRADAVRGFRNYATALGASEKDLPPEPPNPDAPVSRADYDALLKRLAKLEK